MTKQQPSRWLIAGLGNVLRRDDGVGVHAVRELQRCPPAGATVLEIGTAVLHGLSFVESARRVLLLDAMQGDQPPGTIYLFEIGQPGMDGARPAQGPLTPTLSPGRGEGHPPGPSAQASSTASTLAPSPLDERRAGVRGATSHQPTSDPNPIPALSAGRGEGDKLGPLTHGFSTVPTGVPSPLNGERAGVRGDFLQRPNPSPMHSLHSLSLLDAMRALLPHSPLPPVTVIGVEPATLDYGLSLSPAVEAALPRVVALARKVVSSWAAESRAVVPAALAGHRPT